MKQTVAVVLALILLWLPFSIQARAFGGDVDYDSGDGGGYDPGGGDSGDDSDSWNDSGSGSNSGPASYFSTVVVLVLFLVFQRYRRSTHQGESRADLPRGTASQVTSIPGPKVDKGSIDALGHHDPSFDQGVVEAMVEGWVHDFEDAWCRMDMSPCRQRIGEGLFDTYQKQLEQLTAKRQIPRTEDLSVTQCTVESWSLRGTSEFLHVWIDEKKRTYMVSAYNSGEIVQGNAWRVYRLFYRWQLARKAGEGEWKLNKVDKLGQINL